MVLPGKVVIEFPRSAGRLTSEPRRFGSLQFEVVLDPFRLRRHRRVAIPVLSSVRGDIPGISCRPRSAIFSRAGGRSASAPVPSRAETRAPVTVSSCLRSALALSVTNSTRYRAWLIPTWQLFRVVGCGWFASMTAMTLSTVRPRNACAADALAWSIRRSCGSLPLNSGTRLSSSRKESRFPQIERTSTVWLLTRPNRVSFRVHTRGRSRRREAGHAVAPLLGRRAGSVQHGGFADAGVALHTDRPILRREDQLRNFPLAIRQAAVSRTGKAEPCSWKWSKGAVCGSVSGAARLAKHPAPLLRFRYDSIARA